MKRMKRFGIDMKPRFYKDRLEAPYKLEEPSMLFVCSTGDLLGSWVPDEWIESVIRVTEDNPHHIFQFLTKNPLRYKEFEFPPNCWLGTTVDGLQDTLGNTNLLKLAVSHNLRFISFEPLLRRVEPDLSGIHWIIIGADSNRGAEKPSTDWAYSLITNAIEKGIPVFVKDNYNLPMKLKQFPNIPIGDLDSDEGGSSTDSDGSDEAEEEPTNVINMEGDDEMHVLW